MMIRSVSAAAAAVFVLAAAPDARAAEAWQGDVVIDTATAACTNAAGIRADTAIRSVVQPKNIAGNTANTIVTFVYNNLIVFGMVLDHGALAGTAAAFGNSSSGVLKANVGTPYSQFVFTPTQANIVASTPDLTLKGRIQDFMFITNCDVTFRAAYTKRTD